MKRKHLNIFFIFLPILDVITSIITRSFNMPVTPGVIVKGIFMMLMFIYVILSKSKYRKISLFINLFTVFFVLIYFILKPELLSLNYIITEFTYLYKVIYFPVIFTGLLCLYDDISFNKSEINKIMWINLFLMTLLLIVPFITKTAISTYPTDYKGYVGWFFAGNEISNIMVLLYPFIFLSIENHFKILLIPFSIVALFTIGTKVSLWGLLIVNIINVLYFLIKTRISKETITSIIITIICILFIPYSYVTYNTKDIIKELKPKPVQTIVIEKSKAEKVNTIMNDMNKFYEKNQTTKILKKFLSGRDIYLANTLNIYKDNTNTYKKLFGIGYSNTEKINDNNIDKLIEIDILDAYFHIGLVGLIVMFSPYLISLILIIKTKKKITLNSVYLTLILALAFGISTLSGHTYAAPSVSIYIIFYFLLLLNEFKIFKEKQLKEKISILSLHLGYGGIETSIINQANMLSLKYDVEIIVLYKLKEEVNYKINNNVKIIYLSNLYPNKKEFLEAFKSFKLLKTLKEGIKSLYILYNKKTLIINYIINSDSKILISTRIEFTELLNEYGDKKQVKIAEEHVHHNNSKKYIKRLKKSLTKIDYLIPASKYLSIDYEDKFNAKVIYIPQATNFTVKKYNKKENNQLLFVGRLEPVKGVFDLVDVFKLIKTKEVSLTIVGDGSLKKELEDIIKKEKLNIKLTGYLSGNKLKEEYKKASLFIMTSFEESFGLVLLEAMSYQTPCIAFDSALGAKEIINNKNGILIKNRDKSKMAKEIDKFFKEQKNYQKEAMMTAECYTTEKIKYKWYTFIESINEKGVKNEKD